MLSVGFERRILEDNHIVYIFLECRAIQQKNNNNNNNNNNNKRQQQHLSRVAYVTGEVINEHIQRLYSLHHRHRVLHLARVTSPAVAQARALLH